MRIHETIATAVGTLNCAAFVLYAPYRDVIVNYSDLPAFIVIFGVVFLAYTWAVAGLYTIMPAWLFSRDASDPIIEVFRWFPVRKAGVPFWLMALGVFLFLSYLNGLLIYEGFIAD